MTIRGKAALVAAVALVVATQFGITLWWQAVALAPLLYFCHAQYHYNFVTRGRLRSAQKTCYSGSAVHVVTALAPEEEGVDCSAAVKTLVDRARDAGGQVVYVGRVIVPVADSHTIPEQESARFRAVLVTQWPSLDTFKAFRAASLKSATSPWALAWSTPWRRSAVVTFILPLGLYILRLKAALTCTNYDLETRGTKAEMEMAQKAAGGGHMADNPLLFEKVTGLAGKLDAADQNAPVWVWNYLLDHPDKEVSRKNMKYGLNMMQMLAQNGGGAMELGTTLGGPSPGVGLEDEEWQIFENVAAIHYPTISFFSNLVQSRWMQANMQGKEQGDTLALLTVPWSEVTL